MYVSRWILISISLLTFSSAVNAKRPEFVPEKRKATQVKQKAKKPARKISFSEFPEIMSYNQLMAISPAKRLEYLRGLQLILVEMAERSRVGQGTLISDNGFEELFYPDKVAENRGRLELMNRLAGFLLPFANAAGCSGSYSITVGNMCARVCTRTSHKQGEADAVINNVHYCFDPIQSEQFRKSGGKFESLQLEDSKRAALLNADARNKANAALERVTAARPPAAKPAEVAETPMAEAVAAPTSEIKPLRISRPTNDPAPRDAFSNPARRETATASPAPAEASPAATATAAPAPSATATAAPAPVAKAEPVPVAAEPAPAVAAPAPAPGPAEAGSVFENGTTAVPEINTAKPASAGGAGATPLAAVAPAKISVSSIPEVCSKTLLQCEAKAINDIEPDKDSDYIKERAKNLDKFRKESTAGKLDGCVSSGNMSKYKNGQVKAGNCGLVDKFCFNPEDSECLGKNKYKAGESRKERESKNSEKTEEEKTAKPDAKKTKVFTCKSKGEVICNPLVFGAMSDGSGVCVPAAGSQLTVHCRRKVEDLEKADEGKEAGKGGYTKDVMNKKYLRDLLGEGAAGVANAWDDWRDEFAKLCKNGSSSQMAHCEECTVIGKRLQDLKRMTTGSCDNAIKYKDLPTDGGNGEGVH